MLPPRTECILNRPGLERTMTVQNLYGFRRMPLFGHTDHPLFVVALQVELKDGCHQPLPIRLQLVVSRVMQSPMN